MPGADARGWVFPDCDDKYPFTSPVGRFPANAFGLRDMLGNVQQWTEDCWHADYKGAPSDGGAWWIATGNCGLRVLRGGSWANNSRYFRADYRLVGAVGFRLARTSF